LQASAHSLQEARCEACLAHSTEHALQISAHKACMPDLNCEALASNLAQSAQTSAQSLHIKIHSLLPAATQSVMQLSHVVKHAKQASIQFFEIFMFKF
jgi:hypothetical protein